MKKLNTLFLVAMAIFCSITLTSCPADAEDEDCTIGLQEAVELMQERSNTFSRNPTAANCSSLKQSALDVIEKGKKCGDANWEQAAKAWRDIDCSGF